MHRGARGKLFVGLVDKESITSKGRVPFQEIHFQDFLCAPPCASVVQASCGAV